MLIKKETPEASWTNVFFFCFCMIICRILWRILAMKTWRILWRILAMTLWRILTMMTWRILAVFHKILFGYINLDKSKTRSTNLLTISTLFDGVHCRTRWEPSFFFLLLLQDTKTEPTRRLLRLLQGTELQVVHTTSFLPGADWRRILPRSPCQVHTAEHSTTHDRISVSKSFSSCDSANDIFHFSSNEDT